MVCSRSFALIWTTLVWFKGWLNYLGRLNRSVFQVWNLGNTPIRHASLQRILNFAWIIQALVWTFCRLSRFSFLFYDYLVSEGLIVRRFNFSKRRTNPPIKMLLLFKWGFWQWLILVVYIYIFAAGEVRGQPRRDYLILVIFCRFFARVARTCCFRNITRFWWSHQSSNLLFHKCFFLFLRSHRRKHMESFVFCLRLWKTQSAVENIQIILFRVRDTQRALYLRLLFWLLAIELN